MDRELNRVIDAVLSLNRAGQILVAERIVEELAHGNESERLWRQEIGRRLEEMNSGKVQLLPASDVIKEARARIR